MRDDYMDEMLVDIARDNEVASNLLTIKSKIYGPPAGRKSGGSGDTTRRPAV